MNFGWLWWVVIIYAVLSFHKYGTAGVIVLWNFSSTQLWIAKSVGIFKIFLPFCSKSLWCHRSEVEILAIALAPTLIASNKLNRIWTQMPRGFEHKYEEDLNTNTNRNWAQIPRGFEHKYEEDLSSNTQSSRFKMIKYIPKYCQILRNDKLPDRVILSL